MTESVTEPEEYLRRPYARTLIPDPDTGTFTALIEEFPGCVTEGNTPEEAHQRLEQNAKAWIKAALDMGQTIPPPVSLSETSY